MNRGTSARRWLSAAADLLFPPRCAGCGRLGEHWCPDCAAGAAQLPSPLCARCGYPLAAPGEPCVACPQAGFAFDAARAWGAYQGKLRQAILDLKHKPNQALGAALSQPLAGLAAAAGWPADAIVAIPLSAGRLAERGYNPVDLLAQPVATGLGLPLLEEVLRRQRETQPQMALSVRQRWENLRQAFEANTAVKGQTLLLIDDIMTTGATLDAAAAALRAAGAKRVYALTLARTLQARDAGVLVH